MKNELTLSIVIPVYNEENYIKICLDAIMAQTIKPLEIIVVDNNCTDKTIEIAKSYPLVKILHEPVQGRTVSRNRGFNAAKGDIIGRIDADSILMPTWVERVLEDFSDSTVDGLAGLGQTRVLLGLNWYSTFWSRLYLWTVHSLHRVVTMWGANMAIRRTAWLRIRQYTAPDGSKVHEDQDLSLVLVGHGGKIIQDNELLIKTNGVSYLYWPKFWNYFKKSFTMRHYHKQLGTLSQAGSQKLGFWQTLPGGIAGWTMTAFFIVYSLVCWPILALLRHFKKDYKQLR